MASIPTTQKVAVYYRNSDVRIEERPVPRLGPGELLVRIRASGLCGSDVLEWYRIKKAPIVLGHEVAGEVVAVGEGVTQGCVGRRGVVSHHVPCNTCRYCLAGHHTACHTLHTTNFDPGGFAEYVRVPALQTDRGVLELPEGVSFEEGTFVEPLGCVVRGQRSAGLKPGQTVAVFGAGISGILHIALAKALGAGRLVATDLAPVRREMALRFGADAAFDARDDVPARVREACGGRGADLVVVCAGALAPFQQALAAVDAGGTILCFATTDPGTALPVPLNEFWRNDITLKPSYGSAPQDSRTALDLVAARRVPVADMITHRLPLEEAPQGFKLMSTPGGSHLKVILVPQGS
jgi:L-iditol 2-dehydrogenase